MTTRKKSLDQAYFEWLLDQVGAQRGSQTYRDLCWALYKKEFVWIIPNDDNRVADGLDLLVEFFHQNGLEAQTVRVEKGCSFLELIVGLSRRLAFIADGIAGDWAWILLGNLGFHSSSDPLNEYAHRYIDEVCDRVIWRTYEENGAGGLFPLGFSTEDQTKVELWYQMNAYVEENVDPHEMV